MFMDLPVTVMTRTRDHQCASRPDHSSTGVPGSHRGLDQLPEHMYCNDEPIFWLAMTAAAHGTRPVSWPPRGTHFRQSTSIRPEGQQPIRRA